MNTPQTSRSAGAGDRALAIHHSSTAPRLLRALMVTLLALLLLGSLGCGSILGGGDVDPDRDRDRVDFAEIRGEVERVHTRTREIDLWSDDQRRVTVLYDTDTPVYYEGDRYQPTNLEAGDLIVIDAERGSGGAWLAQSIEVEAGRQDRADDRYDDDPFEDDDPFDDDEITTLTGEVRAVDTLDREIQIDTGQGVRSFEYRNGTIVRYRGETYQVDALERGDVIRVELEQGFEGGWLVDEIVVTESVQDRAGSDGPYDDRYDLEGQRYAGTVEDVDPGRGEFVLRTERYGTQTVVMPYDASASDRREFEDLRRGDYVRLEGEPAERGRIELLRFGWSAS